MRVFYYYVNGGHGTIICMIRDDFGHWFAGFVDGEGCFQIPHTLSGYRCLFEIKLREDDLPVLKEIQNITQLGIIRKVKHKEKIPNVNWIVYRKNEVIALRDIFLTYPLRAKKKADFELWNCAIQLWETTSRKKADVDMNKLIWREMKTLKESMTVGRLGSHKSYQGFIDDTLYPLYPSPVDTTPR